MHKLALPALLLGLLCFPGSVARAEDALKVELVSKALVGKGQPELVVKAKQRLHRLDLDVTRSSDGKRLRQRAGPVRGGREHRFPLTMAAPGRARFTGTLSVQFGEGDKGSMPIEVEVELLPEIKPIIEAADVDLAAHQLRLRANRAFRKAQIALMSDAGAPLGTTEREWSTPVGADEKVQMAWEQANEGTVLRMTVQVWDESDFFGAVDLFPWRVDIPHEEVNFATGSSEITKTEVTKLEHSYDELDKALDKYGKLAKVQLFIAGHTDTVGDAGSNRALSDQRARSIGRWFKKRGVRVPIRYAGFGEDLLLVQTPDNTDQAKNRRAEYIVAVEAPAMAGARWRLLD